MKKSIYFTMTFGIILLASLIGCKKSSAQAPKSKNALYSVQANNTTLTKGKTGQASFDINLYKGAEIHAKAPFKCQLQASDGLDLAKKTLGHADVTVAKNHKKALVSVKITAKKTGKQFVNFDCSFFVCTKDICARHHEKLHSTITVK